MPTYEKYLRFRRLLQEEGPVASRNASPIILWRDRQSVYPFYANKCRNCGTVSYPIQRVCIGCMSKDNFEQIPLAKQGKIFTMTRDALAAGPDGELLPVAVVEMDNGCRVHCEVTDVDAFSIDIDAPVEMTFRKINDRGGYHNYWWKARPIR